jgi:hypothetical protein
VAGELKVAITDIAPTGHHDPFGFGPVRSLVVEVINVGDEPWPLRPPSARGSLGPGTPNVIFTAMSVGPPKELLAPGARQAFVLQNISRSGQNVIYNGSIQVTVRTPSEERSANNTAVASKMVIRNPPP